MLCVGCNALPEEMGAGKLVQLRPKVKLINLKVSRLFRASSPKPGTNVPGYPGTGYAYLGTAKSTAVLGPTSPSVASLASLPSLAISGISRTGLSLDLSWHQQDRSESDAARNDRDSPAGPGPRGPISLAGST
jgi:hypothetical protein